ncbi:MAG TPA: dTMP kinase [Myxococcales bacterium]
MFIVFEGIEGSGKTTLSDRVTARLRGLGHRVCHAREAGALASPVAERIRSLVREVRPLALCETSEFLLHAAREAQSVEEIVRPALARGDWVVADRFVYSRLALARERGELDPAALWPVLQLASAGLSPDLVVFVDVEPSIASARRRCGRLAAGKGGDPGHEGQAGAGLPCRVRRCLYRLAQADPDRWLVFDNTWASLDEAEEAIVRSVLSRAEGQPAPALPRSRGPAGLPGPADVPRDERAVRRCLLAAVDAVASREPPLAAWLVRGLSGADVDERRLRLALKAPAVVAHGLAGLGGAGPMALRHALKAVVPDEVARSLTGLWGDEALGLRRELEDRAPRAVARSLAGVLAPQAMAVRAELAPRAPAEVLEGLSGVATDEAWELRRALSSSAPLEALARSLAGLDSQEAWALRESLLAGAPLAVVESLAGLASPHAFELRRRFLPRAPRAVLDTLAGLEGDEAFALREAAGERMREAVESAAGLGSERAWTLRERLLAVWPASVVRSLSGLAHAARGRELLFRVLERASGDLEVLREAAWVLDDASAPERPLSRTG